MANNLKNFDGLITSMDYDNRYIYTLSDHTMFVWDKLDYTLTRTLDCSNDVEAVTDFSVNSKCFYAIGRYNFMVLDKNTAKMIYHYKFGCNINSNFCYFFDDVEKIYLSIQDSHVIAIDKTDYMNTHILDEHNDSVKSIASDQDFVYTGSNDHSVAIWDKKNYELCDTLTDHSDDVLVDVCDQFIYSASSSSIIVYDKETREERLRHTDTDGTIDYIKAWNNSLITMSTVEGTIKIWDVNDSFKLKSTIEIPRTPYQAVMFDEGLLYIATKNNNGITILNLEEQLNK